MTRHRAAALATAKIVGALGLAACAEVTSGDIGRPNAEIAHGELSLVRVVLPAARVADQTSTSVAAHFAAYEGVDADTVAAALDLWTPSDVDGCVVVPAPETPTRAAAIELRSAGAVGVSGDGEAVRLEPRPLAFGPTVNGVVYGSAPGVGLEVAPEERLVVWADGDGVPPFTAELAAPGHAELVAIDGVELDDASEAAIGSGTELSIELLADATPVYLSFRRPGVAVGARVECRFDAASVIAVDRARLLGALGDPEEVELTVRTVAAASPAIPVVRVQVERADRVTLHAPLECDRQ